jgi:hypothetical protein
MDMEPVTEPPHDAAGGPEHAWRVHGALDSWTGKVDSKASTVLAIESAVLAFVITLTEPGKAFHDLHGAERVCHRAGLVLLIAAVALALAVVVPQLNRRASRRDWHTNTIYFGHLRHWDPDALADTLRTPARGHGQDRLAQALAPAGLAAVPARRRPGARHRRLTRRHDVHAAAVSAANRPSNHAWAVSCSPLQREASIAARSGSRPSRTPA